ncbi:hypothetical protein LV82_00737 [Albidovulum inexpectatum]|uniref:Component of SufBCD complex n=1 Tax=Albidovulum inexpectatum TaxID=196587 RepID=A0A2S5JJI2_9RHOB|nr:component of SufBCD complex [Albidovulum inexpectatum]PPB81528.1 hypothetical protein LV82_00737 [Albidovulum inexpectatum]
MDLKTQIFDLIDLRSFSNLWYWIALAVTWSTTSHWILGVPFDMVVRARRLGGQATQDLETLVRIHIGRITYIVDEAGTLLSAMIGFILSVLATTGFVYGAEFSQAVFLIAAPLTIVAVISVRAARAIQARGLRGEGLMRHLSVLRLGIQIIGMISIFITAFWGMLQNYNVSILPG